MRRIIMLAAAVAASSLGLGFGLRADDRPDDKAFGADRYSIDCRIVQATDNDRVPPTLFGTCPSKGQLTFVGVAEVTNGRFGDTRLEGAKFGFFGRSSGDWK